MLSSIHDATAQARSVRPYCLGKKGNEATATREELEEERNSRRRDEMPVYFKLPTDQPYSAAS